MDRPRSRRRKNDSRRGLRTASARPPSAGGDTASPALRDQLDCRRAGLLWVTPEEYAGIRRLRQGSRFAYRTPAGKPVKDLELLDRIRSLVIPPAWRDVWICRDERGHIQAVGRDALGRRQYRYHPAWQAHRSRGKFERMADFGRTLPRIRRRVDRDLDLPGTPERDRVLAAIVRLLERTLVRVGNDEYARANRSYGLTTLRRRHVTLKGPELSFQFRGKRGIEHRIDVTSPRLAKIVRYCRSLRGRELFQVRSESGDLQDLKSHDVNEYIRKAAGGADFTAKDFRTWFASVLAFAALRQSPLPESKAAARRQLKSTVEAVASRLGNTPAVCKKSYIHPEIVDSYLKRDPVWGAMAQARKGRDLRREERLFLDFLSRKP